MAKKRNYLIIMLLIVCCLFTGCKKETVNTESTKANDEQAQNTNNIPLVGEANKQGNSIGNLNEYGLLAKQGDWIYFNYSEEGLFRKETVDGTNGETLAECCPYYINVVGEWIYYCEWSDKSLWKMKVDGTEMQQLSDDYVDYVYVEDEWIYYKGSEDNNSFLCRMRIDGSDNEKIFDDAYCVYQGRIYYQKEIPNSEDQLCSISIGGSDEKVLVDGRISYLNVDDNWIYYRGDDESHCLYKMKIDGTEKVCLTTVSAANVIVWDEWIYFIAYDEDDALETDMIYRIKKDGTNVSKGEEFVKTFLEANGKLTLRELADRTGKSAAATSRMLATLEEKGVVEKERTGKYVTYKIRDN